jgi:hypothetical protein
MKPLITLLSLALLTACAELPLPDGALVGPFFRPENISSPSPKLPDDLQRVLILIPADTTPDRILTPETISDLHRTLLSSLTNAARFELIPIGTTDLIPFTQGKSLSSTAPIPSGVIEQLARKYRAQGILFTDITSYSAYQPLKLALRTKLARLDNLQILWASDNLFSAADPRVANSARNYAKKHSSGQPGNLTYTILQNPTRFAEYTTSTLCDTLPHR